MPSAMRHTVSLFAAILVCGADPMPCQEPAPAPRGQAAAKIDPALLIDAEQLATAGFVREYDRVLHQLRVVIEIERQPGDVTFATSKAVDRLADVQAAVIARQAQFVESLQQALTPAQLAGVQILFPLELQYMLAAEVADGVALRALAAAPGVLHVWKDNLNQPHTIEGRILTGSTLQAALGNSGAGIGVALLDSNVDLLHTELGGSTTLPNSVVKGGSNFSTVGGPIHSQTWGDCYHGTGTSSIVRRYAPGCHLYSLVVFPNSFDSVIASAINWCVANKNGVGGGSPIRVINMSLGSGRHFATVNSGTLHTACDTALSNGIVCVASSGNDGWTDSMSLPAASGSCISVGSTWDANNATYFPFGPTNCVDSNRLVDERACYSNTASFLAFYCPSEQVFCAQCGGGTFDLGGTSSASPAAAGLIAQLMDARPQYLGNRAGIITLFQGNGIQVIGDTTKRRVHLTNAINATTPRQLRFTGFPAIAAQAPGASITLAPTVINDGQLPSGPFDVEFFLSSSTNWSVQDVYLGKVAMPSLAVGQSLVAQLQTQLPWRTLPSIYVLNAIIDRTNQVQEWDETDNQAFVGLFVTAAPCVTKMEYDDSLMTSYANAAVSVTTGGIVHPTVVAPCANPLTTLYLIAWSGSGTSPGLPLSPTVTLPLNPDSFTDLGLAAFNGPVLVNFVGLLDSHGIGRATFNLPPATGLTGVQTHLAAVLIGGPNFWDAASNPIPLQLTP